jgi:hypothetical protein
VKDTVAKSSTPKWKVVENVVAAIESSLASVPGTKVVRNALVPTRIGGQPRQVDVYIEIPTGPRSLRVAIEVRDKTRVLSIEQVEQLCSKLRGLDIDSGCIVTTVGVSKTALAHAEAMGIEIKTVAQVAMPEWWSAADLHVHAQQVELLDHKVNFSSGTDAQFVAEKAAGAKLQDIQMIRPGLESRSLWEVITGEGTKALDHPAFAELKNGEVFNLQVSMSGLPEGTHLRFGDLSLPMFNGFLATYRLHQKDETVPVSVFKHGQNLTAFTGAIPSLKRQLTLLVEECVDGSRRMSARSGASDPPRTSVPRRSLSKKE